MNGQILLMNDRKRFLLWAAVAAVVVLVSGGENVLAYNVICVPNMGVNPSCTVAPSPHTIQEAVTYASPFDIIYVGPGTYNENVVINTASISLFGAQAGNDARVDRHDPSKESIVNAGRAGPAFTVNANFVVIDGFTVEGGIPAGIYVSPTGPAPVRRPQVLNNILQNNSTGVYLACSTTQSVEGATAERNLFRNNNLAPGISPGVGMASVGKPGLPPVLVQAAVITENEFTGNQAVAISVALTIGATITENTSENDGSLVVFRYTSDSQFTDNQGKNFGHTGVLAWYHGDAAIDIGPNNADLEISHNTLEKGEAPISNGMAFTTAFGKGVSDLLNVVGNKIGRFPGYGIVAEESSVVGTDNESSIIDNQVYENGRGGIFIERATSNNSGLLLFDNDAEGNGGYDCEDGTTGSFTSGTANTWFNNIGNTSSPAGLCAPGKKHN